MTVNAKPFSPLLVLPLFAACAQTPEPESALNFDDCLITHMAVISVLEDTPTDEVRQPARWRNQEPDKTAR